MADNTVKLKLNPGFFKNGTEYQAAGRWLDGDLVRWHNDNIKPINGWQRKALNSSGALTPPLWSVAGEAARSCIAVGSIPGGVNLFFGSNKGIYQISSTNFSSDVSPAGFVDKDKDASSDTGYGRGRYNQGLYGVARSTHGSSIPMVFSWGFTTWGEWPVACARGDDALHVFLKKPTDTLFLPIANSPTGVNDVIVTDERFMMTFGTPTDSKLIQWSDQEDYNEWTTAIDNQAGFIRVSGTGALVRAVKLLNQILVLGDTDAFTGQYVGPPYVYGFTRAGNRCGIVGPEAVVTTEAFAAWLGLNSFWIYDGVVRQLSCEVLDFLLNDMDTEQRSKTSAFTISDYSECWWLYQSKGSTTGDVDSYVVYNYGKQIWYTGRMDRTTGMDSNPARTVVMVSPTGRVYDHEIMNAGREGRIPFIETGPMELNSGERLLGLAYVFPDEKLSGSLKMELQVRGLPNYVNDEPSEILYSRDFQLLHPTSTHGIMGRDIRMKLYGSQSNQNWVLGDFRVMPIKSAGPGR